MEEDTAYQLAAFAVGAAIVAAIRLNPDCDQSDIVSRVLKNVSGHYDFEVDEDTLPPLTGPAVYSLNHRLNIAVGYLGFDENEHHSAHDEVNEIIENYVLENIANQQA